MEVIVDDSQLSLAIGKKGQNVRLAAKLLGWKIDIKSEEEKRQEVQNAIEQLSTGAPVSVLIDHGLAEATVDALVKGDIGTVERLGSMTPEELEALEGIDEDAVNRIQQAINGFYGQEYSEEPPAQDLADDLIQDTIQATTAPDEFVIEIVKAESAENPEIADNSGPPSDDTMGEPAESVADGDVEGHSAAKPGEEHVP
jgi:transcription termination/antitermination protein NusA